MYGLKMKLPQMSPHFVSKASLYRNAQSQVMDKPFKQHSERLPAVPSTQQNARPSHEDIRGTNTLAYSETVYNTNDKKGDDTVFKFTAKNATSHKVGDRLDEEDDVSQVIEDDNVDNHKMAKSQKLKASTPNRKDHHRDITKSDFIESRFSKGDGFESVSQSHHIAREEPRQTVSNSESAKKQPRPLGEEFQYSWFCFFTDEIFCSISSLAVKDGFTTYYVPFGVAKIALESADNMRGVLSHCLFNEADRTLDFDYEYINTLKSQNYYDITGFTGDNIDIGGKQLQVMYAKVT